MVSFVSYSPFLLGCFGISCCILFFVMHVLVVQCLDLASPTSLVVLLVPYMQSNDLLLHTSSAVSRVLVLRLWDPLLPSLLDDEVFFALILEEFLGTVLALIILKATAVVCASPSLLE